MDINTSLDSSSERFIPLRGSSFESLKISHKHPSPVSISCRDYYREFTENESGVNYMQYLYKKNQYKDMLVNTLFQSPRRVLYFSPKQKIRKIDDTYSIENDWPVRSRKKPLITTPEFTFDMPEVADSTAMTDFRQRVDWGSSGYIAAIHKNCCIHTYNPDTNNRNRIIIAEKLENCLKWNTEGNRLAISLKHSSIGIMDMNSAKMVINKNTRVGSKISYIVYTRYFFITVHLNGMIQLWNHDLCLITSVAHAHKGVILSAKVSCHENYLATNGVDSVIRIWSMPSCRNIYEIHLQPDPIVSIDWHPWKESLLAIGRSTRNSFCSLWDVNKPSDVCMLGQGNDVFIDCISFNPLSAELVVGFWLDRQVGNNNIVHNIVVQSNLHTVVDDINLHSGRILNLMWDKEGKRLATVGADENLFMWKFFGQDRKKEDTSIKRENNMFTESIIR